MENILLTGGAGNVGSALAKRILKEGKYYLTIVDNLLTGNEEKLPDSNLPNWRFIKADVNEINDIGPVMLANRFDYVFHFAAVVGVQRTQDNPISVLRDIDGIRNILNLAKNSSVKRVFFSSSSEVYGEPVELPQHEHRTPLNSRVPYAVVKNVGECFFKSYKQEFDLNYTIFRFFNTYGPNQSTDFVIARFLAAALNNEDITLYGDGSQTRTFTYVDDTVDACLFCLTENLHVNDVINIGSEKLVTIRDLAEMIIAITESKSKIVNLPPLIEGDMTRRQPDNAKMKALLNRELIPLEDGIRRMMSDKYFLKQIKF